MSIFTYKYYNALGLGRSFWKPGKNARLAVNFTCELSFILFGIEQGIIGNLTTGDDFLNQFGRPTGSYLGIIVSIYTLGCFFGCICNYITGNTFGRRFTLALSMVLIIIGVLLQACAYTVPHFMVGRFISGLGTGFETSCVPMYQAEMARASVRGALVCSEAMFVGIGLIYAYWLTYGLSFCSGPIAWRLPISTQIIFSLIILGLTLTIPESPRYLYIKGDKEHSKANLTYLLDKSEDDDEVVEMYDEIEESTMMAALKGEYSWKQIFTKSDASRTRHRIILAYMSMFAQQIGGINFLNYYITTIFMDNVGLTRNLSMILSGCAEIVFTIGSMIPSFFSDKLGRRLPLVYGHIGGCICMVIIAILLSFTDSRLCAKASIAFIFIFQFDYGASANCIPWVLVPELLPLHARSRGTAIGISANWLWNFFIVEVAPEMIANITWQSYIVFACTNFAFALMFFFCYPETKGLTLEAIDRLFVDKHRFTMGLVDTRVYLHRYKKDIENISMDKPEDYALQQSSSNSAKQDVEFVEDVGASKDKSSDY